MLLKCKLLFVKLGRFFLKAGYVFPVRRNKVLFMSHKGRSYSCNPKYIFETMYEKYPGKFSYIWVTDGTWTMAEKGIEARVKSVPYNSLLFLYHMLTCKVMVSNTGVSTFIPKRSSQTFINTWHAGGAYKTVSCDVHKDEYRQQTSVMAAEATDVVLSSCSRFTEAMKGAILVRRDKFFMSGLPRNDNLYNKKSLPMEAVRSHYGIPMDAKIVLFAPTYRDGISGERDRGSFCNQLDESECLRALKLRFGKEWVFCYRSHIFAPEMDNPPEGIDVSDYEDMQELLLLSDVLITDYSSCIWDFALTGKPGFIFAPDLQEYISERNFYTPIEKWPYPVATDNESLCALIRSYDEDEAKKKIDAHFELMGSYESGKASETVAGYIRHVIAG